MQVKADYSSQENEAPPVDCLLSCLIRLAQEQHIPFSYSSLTSGLPLVGGCITPQLFARSAHRLGLASRVVERDINDIPEEVYPVVLMLNENHAVLLEGVNRGENTYVVFDPLGNEQKTFGAADLMAEYSGYAIYVKPILEHGMHLGIDNTRYRSHWFWGTIFKSWRIYRDVLLASILINVFVLANPLFVMNVYDRVVPNDAIETLWVLAIGVAFVYICDFVLKLLRVYFIEVAGKKSDVLLSSYILERVLGARYSEHPRSTGSFVSQLREFEAIRNFITSSTVTAFVDLPFVVLFLVVIAYIGGVVAWVPLVAIPLVLGYAMIVQHLLKNSVAHAFTASAQKNSTLVESISGLETIKALGAEGRAQRAWEDASGLLSFWSLKSRLLSNSASSVAQFLQQLASVAVVIVGVYAIAERELTMGALIACVILAGRVLAPLAQIAGLLVQYQQSVLALQSLDSIVNTEQELDHSGCFIRRENLTGGVEFRDVVFRYPGEEVVALDGVSFKVEPGEHVAIIGRLGSGKSTIQKLVLGLFQPSSGMVLLDGLDLRQLDLADVRKSTGYVPQDATLFHGSLRNNIAYKNEWVDEDELLRVADLCGITDIANSHPQGFNRTIYERGEGLSGGQRQAVTVARGMVNKPDLLLLDEPTSAMDSTSEARLLKSLKIEAEGRTLLLVTHKTSLLTLVNRVIVMDKGRVIADGSRDTVLDALKTGRLKVT